MMFLAQLGTMPGFHYFSPAAGIFKVQKRKEKFSISQPFLAFEKFLQVQRQVSLVWRKNITNIHPTLQLNKKRNEQIIYFMFCSS